MAKKQKLANVRTKTPIKDSGSESNEKFVNIEASRVEKVIDAGIEASIVIKGNFDVQVLDDVNLTVYCPDGTVHIISGTYKVEEKVDLIERDFTTTLKMHKTKGVAGGRQLSIYDDGLVSTGVQQSTVSKGVKIPKIEGSGSGVEVVNCALEYVGRPYVYGGNSLESGIDCSHFVSKILAMCGHDYGYHWSGDWRHIGDDVPFDQAQAGDVLCYNGHVAFFIDNSHIVHARGKKYGIEVTETNPFTYHHGCITCRRVV